MFHIESRECAQLVNKKLFELVSSSNEMVKDLDIKSVMEVLRQYLAHSSVNTKVAAMQWIHHLFTELKHDEMADHAVVLFPVLLDVLSDGSDEVVLQGLEVLAALTSDRDPETKNQQYRKLLLSLLNLFSEEKAFLENKGGLIIRQLCVLLNPELVFRTFADIIMDETANIKFASTMVRTLNLILLTSSELFELRTTLRNITDPKSALLFECLYRCWSHCPVSTLSLCLLSQCYQHVRELVILFGDLEITMEFLVELDKLVQIIESPIFACNRNNTKLILDFKTVTNYIHPLFTALRLTLISNRNGSVDRANLTQALFGILMLLPQTEAFNLLKNRLQCVMWDQVSKTTTSTELSVEQQSGIDFTALMAHFKSVHQGRNRFQ